MSRAVRRIKGVRWIVMLSISLVIVMTGALCVSAEQPPTSAPPPGASAPSPPEAAGEDITSDVELTRAAIQLRRQALVTAVMDLAPKEAEAFWPLYREYRMEMAKVGDRLVNPR